MVQTGKPNVLPLTVGRPGLSTSGVHGHIYTVSLGENHGKLCSCYTLIYINHFRLYHYGEVMLSDIESVQVHAPVCRPFVPDEFTQSVESDRESKETNVKQHHLLKLDNLKTVCEKFMMKKVEEYNCI